MKAIVKYAPGPGSVECREVPVPDVPAGCIRLKTYAAAVCGTDLHILHDEYAHKEPVILGHEHVGVVDAAGEGVQGFEKGDTAVSLARVWVCGKCEYCKKGLFLLCPEGKSIGVGRDGAMAEYVIVPADKAFKVSGPPKKEYALFEPLVCCWRAVKAIARPEAGQYALVSGPGFMGQMTAQILRRCGVTVIMSGMPADAERLAQARRIGADYTCTSPEEIQKTLDLLGLEGVQYSFECAGAKGSFANCLRFTKKLGIITQVGLYRGPIEVDVNGILYKEIQLRTSYGADYTSFREMLEEQEREPFVLAPYISSVYSLEQCREAFADAASPASYKVIFTP